LHQKQTPKPFYDERAFGSTTGNDFSCHGARRPKTAAVALSAVRRWSIWANGRRFPAVGRLQGLKGVAIIPGLNLVGFLPRKV
jgi:hypothetical protein